jgi:hypothetical protein
MIPMIQHFLWKTFGINYRWKSNEVASQSGGIGGLLNQFNGNGHSNGGGFLDIVKDLGRWGAGTTAKKWRQFA